MINYSNADNLDGLLLKEKIVFTMLNIGAQFPRKGFSINKKKKAYRPTFIRNISLNPKNNKMVKHKLSH